jgi:hypothetical protein
MPRKLNKVPGALDQVSRDSGTPLYIENPLELEDDPHGAKTPLEIIKKPKGNCKKSALITSAILLATLGVMKFTCNEKSQKPTEEPAPKALILSPDKTQDTINKQIEQLRQNPALAQESEEIPSFPSLQKTIEQFQ